LVTLLEVVAPVAVVAAVGVAAAAVLGGVTGGVTAWVVEGVKLVGVAAGGAVAAAGD
jgi:hypothetical protein